MHHIQTRYNILHILFWMISCCINGFVAIYLKSKGLDNTLIGIVTGASCILITLISPFVTSLLNKIQNLTIPKLIGYISKMVNSRNRINEKIIFLHINNTEEICNLMHSFLD